MRNTAFLAFGLLLIIVQSNFFRLVGMVDLLDVLPAGISPSLVLPLVVFMGVHEYSLARGAALAFALGYLVDVFASAPIGLYTFTSVLTFVAARVAGVRLAAQTLLTQVALAFAFSLLEGGLIVGLTAIFGGDAQRPRALARLVPVHALSTAFLAPVVFRVAERLHQATITVPRPVEMSKR